MPGIRAHAELRRMQGTRDGASAMVALLCCSPLSGHLILARGREVISAGARAAFGTNQLARRNCLEQVAYRMVTHAQFPPKRQNRLTNIYPMNSQLPELCRKCLLQYLRTLLSCSWRRISTLPLEGELRVSLSASLPGARAKRLFRRSKFPLSFHHYHAQRRERARRQAAGAHQFLSRKAALAAHTECQ